MTLLFTLLHQGKSGAPLARRVIIVCPTSLVSNWDQECEKWLKGRVRTTPVAEATKADVISSLASFLSPRSQSQVLIISYETFRLHMERLMNPAACDLLICDEAHRLKNDATLTNQALNALPCLKRVLLSGTPIQARGAGRGRGRRGGVQPSCVGLHSRKRIAPLPPSPSARALQNKLDEFYAMASFANPGLLGARAAAATRRQRRCAPPPLRRGRPRAGTPAEFRKHYENPILAGREPDASDAEQKRGQERATELRRARPFPPAAGSPFRRAPPCLPSPIPPPTAPRLTRSSCGAPTRCCPPTCRPN